MKAVSTARNVGNCQGVYNKRMQRCAVIWQEERFRRLNTIKGDKIQGDSGGKVSVVGGDSVGHCEKKNIV